LDAIDGTLQEQNEATVKREEMLYENTERTKAIQALIERHEEALYGNGKPGLIADVQSMKVYAKVIATVLSMILTAIIAQLVAYLSRAGQP